jgi:hypothetical protein
MAGFNKHYDYAEIKHGIGTGLCFDVYPPATGGGGGERKPSYIGVNFADISKIENDKPTTYTYKIAECSSSSLLTRTSPITSSSSSSISSSEQTQNYFLESYTHNISDNQIDETQLLQTTKVFDASNLTPLTIREQNESQELTPEKKQLADYYGQLYEALNDELDGVHDFRTCTENLIKLIEELNSELSVADQNKQKNDDIIGELKYLINQICTQSGNINVESTHRIQRQIITRYISKLRELGFIIGDLPELIALDKRNPDSYTSYLNGIIRQYRESGRALPKIPEVEQTMGALDGCGGKCALRSKPETWTHRIAGYITTTLTLEIDGQFRVIAETSIHRLELTGRGKIILDNITEHIMGIGKIRGQESEDTDTKSNKLFFVSYTKQGISKNIGEARSDQAFRALCRAVKAILDKLFISETPRYAVGDVVALVTVDNYVWGGALLAILSGKIEPIKIFTSNKTGWNLLTYGDNSRIELEKNLFRLAAFYLLRHKTHVKPETEKKAAIQRLSTVYDNLETCTRETLQSSRNVFTRTNNLWEFLKNYSFALNQRNYETDMQTFNSNLEDCFKVFTEKTLQKDKQLELISKVPFMPNLVEYSSQLDKHENTALIQLQGNELLYAMLAKLLEKRGTTLHRTVSQSPMPKSISRFPEKTQKWLNDNYKKLHSKMPSSELDAIFKGDKSDQDILIELGKRLNDSEQFKNPLVEELFKIGLSGVGSQNGLLPELELVKKDVIRQNLVNYVTGVFKNENGNLVLVCNKTITSSELLIDQDDYISHTIKQDKDTVELLGGISVQTLIDILLHNKTVEKSDGRRKQNPIEFDLDFNIYDEIFYNIKPLLGLNDEDKERFENFIRECIQNPKDELIYTIFVRYFQHSSLSSSSSSSSAMAASEEEDTDYDESSDEEDDKEIPEQAPSKVNRKRLAEEELTEPPKKQSRSYADVVKENVGGNTHKKSRKHNKINSKTKNTHTKTEQKIKPKQTKKRKQYKTRKYRQKRL